MHVMRQLDIELSKIIEQEQTRQAQHIELIASENYVSRAVLEAQGSVLTNKYAEGYPGKRYYGGCEYVDQVENLAVMRAKSLFKADYANVQPHSGSQANAAAYMALLSPGDCVLGMRLSEGGHLTHGASVNFSGKLYQFVHYGLDASTGDIDYDELEVLALKHRPKLIVAGFSAFSLVLDWHRFREIADKIGAYLLADIAHVAGLIVTGHYPSPIPFADVITSTTHKTLRGPRGGLILAKRNPMLEKRLNSAVFPGMQGGPLLHVIAGKAAAFFEAMQPAFTSYQAAVIENANAMVEAMRKRKFSIVSGGTKNHLFMLNLTNKKLTGKQGEVRLEEACITLNKNMVPRDTQSPFVTSGLRIGTPAITTRGFGVQEAQQVAHWICDILDDIENDALIASIREKVNVLCHQFPVYC